MTLQFQLRREDALAFSKAYHASSPTYLRTRNRSRWMLPALMALLWIVLTWTSGFELFRTVVYALVSVVWFLFYPKRFDLNVQRYAEKTLAEPGFEKTLGDYTLTLSPEGIHSSYHLGAGLFRWEALDRAELTDDHLMLFLTGAQGFPIRISEIGREAAEQVMELVRQYEQEAGANPPSLPWPGR